MTEVVIASAARTAMKLGPESVVLIFNTEGTTGPEITESFAHPDASMVDVRAFPRRGRASSKL